MQLLPGKGLYFEIFIVLSMSESVILPKPLPRHFWLFGIIVILNDLNASSISLSLVIASAFEFE